MQIYLTIIPHSGAMQIAWFDDGHLFWLTYYGFTRRSAIAQWRKTTGNQRKHITVIE